MTLQEWANALLHTSSEIILTLTATTKANVDLVPLRSRSSWLP